MGSSTRPPNQFFIIPDPKVRELSVLSSTSQGGKFPSVGTPSTSNNGSLSVFCTGTQTADENYDVRVQDSGKLGETTFVYKKTDEADSLYKGEPDRRFPRAHSSPFGDYNYGYASTGAYCKKANLEVVAAVSQTNSNKIDIKYRTLSENSNSNESWSSYTFSAFSAAFNYRRIYGAGSSSAGIIQAATISMCETSDGSILLIVRNGTDIDVYLSEDAINWTLLSTDILSRFSGSDTRIIQQIRAASSGNYVRIVFVGEVESDFVLLSMVSTDNGISWEDSDLYSYDGTSGLYAGKTVPYGVDNWSFDLCGIGDESGTFLMCVSDQSLATIRSFLTSGSQAWNYVEGLTYSLPVEQEEAPTIFLASGDETDWIWLLLDGTRFDTGKALVGSQAQTTIPSIPLQGGGFSAPQLVYPTNYEQDILYLPKSDNLESSTWRDLGKYYHEENQSPPLPAVSGFNTARLYRFSSSGGAFIARGAFCIVSGLMDSYDGSTLSGRVARNIYMRFGGWDTNPEFDYDDPEFVFNPNLIPPKKMNPTYRRAMLEWVSWIGAPAGFLYARQTSDNTWTENRQGATRNWNAERMRLTSNSASTEFIFYEWEDPSINHVQYNWAFQVSNPLYQEPSNNFPVKELGGNSCFSWMCKAQGTPSTVSNLYVAHCAVDIQGFVEAANAVKAETSDYGLNVRICIAGNQIKIFDMNTLSTLSTIDIDTSVYGSLALTNFFWEYRFAFYGRTNASTDRTACLIIRKEGSEEWITTGAFNVPTHSVTQPSKRKQKVSFGLINSQGISRGGFWKYFFVHPKNDLRTIAYGGAVSTKTKPDIIRGKTISGSPTYLRSGLSTVWGGASGAEADMFTIEPTYTYPVSNSVKFSSPRQQWRSAGTTDTLSMVINSAATTDKFWHDSAMIVRTNAKTIDFAYSTDNVSYTTSGTVNLSRMKGKITAVDGAMVAVEFDKFNISNTPPNRIARDGEFSSTREQCFYARFTNNVSSTLPEDTPYKIDRHWNTGTKTAKLQLEMTAIASGFNSTLVGSTLMIYSDRGWSLLSTSPPKGDKSYMKVTLNGSASEPEGYLYAGTISAGTSLTMNVPFSWQFSDKEVGNNEIFSSKSNLTWGYCNSGAARQFSGTIKGDVSDQLRQRIRDALRKATNYEKDPLLFVLQDDDNSNEFMLWGRVTSGSDQKNDGWYWDAVNLTWKPVGDLSVTIDEVI